MSTIAKVQYGNKVIHVCDVANSIIAIANDNDKYRITNSHILISAATAKTPANVQFFDL